MAGPPKIICSICGEMVLKSQTYHIGDGKRACKVHDGVMNQAMMAQDKIKQDKKKKVEDEAKRRRKLFHGDETLENFFKEASKWANETCWFCGKEGRPLQEFFTRRLVALEKLKMKGNVMTLFDNPDMIIKEAGFSKETIFLNRIKIPDEQIKKIISKIQGGPDKQGCAELAGFVLSCPDCANKMGLEFMPKTPSVDLKTLAVLGTLYEKNLGPTIRLTAGMEILKEEKDKENAAPFN